MVQQHAERMAQEKEQNALQKLAVLLPQLGFFARLMALQETSWDVDRALTLLRRFVAENDLQLKAIHKVGVRDLPGLWGEGLGGARGHR